MIKKITILSVIAVLIFSLIYVDKSAFCWTDGQQGPGYSGSPGDNYNDCSGNGMTQCHFTEGLNVTGWIITDIPSTGFIGGTVYSITCKAPNSAQYGLEITAETAGGNKVGYFASGAGFTVYSNKSCVSNQLQSSWVYSWTAPANGTGPVTFYASFAATETQAKNCFLTVQDACTAPSVSISPVNPTICKGEQTTLTANGNSTAYVWSNLAINNSITVEPDTTTIYTVTGTLAGCPSYISTTVTVKDLPATPVITQIGTYLSSSATTGNQWYNSSGLITGATGQTYTPTTVDTYYVIVTENGCESEPSNSIFTSIPHTPDATYSFEIYPNPATDVISVSYENIKNVNFYVYNVQGKLLFTKSAKNKNTKINISDLGKGVYFIKAECAEGTIIKRFVKE
ncbi:MAG TPA: T9SS type A sorting domain-containing protein [Bacteroidales bacterium]|nr:T9SS type A sorting domain-containing protein [Bacteroidales bacterium]HPS18400.1 T9SS type A sorting domain-containing protein [Bacteroidales bacterium]